MKVYSPTPKGLQNEEPTTLVGLVVTVGFFLLIMAADGLVEGWVF